MHRIVDPLVSSFLSPDMIVPELDNPATWNRCSYVYGNPVKFNDPSGHYQNLSGAAWTICAEVVLAVAPVVHKANEYRGDIFFPDANTTFADRLEASTITGGGPVLVEGAPVIVVKAIPYVYSAHAAATTAAAAHPVAATATGGTIETAVECGLTGVGCTAGDYALGMTTAGVTSRASRPSLPGKADVQVPCRLTPEELHTLTLEHGVEFAVVYKTGPDRNGGRGTYWLYSGTVNEVEVPLGFT